MRTTTSNTNYLTPEIIYTDLGGQQEEIRLQRIVTFSKHEDELKTRISAYLILSMRPRFIQAFNVMPKEIFRINNGIFVRLRDYPGPVKPKGVFDLLTKDGKVHPSVLNPQDYDFPNGASMRPNSRRQQHLVRKLDNSSGCIYAVPQGSGRKL